MSVSDESEYMPPRGQPGIPGEGASADDGMTDEQVRSWLEGQPVGELAIAQQIGTPRGVPDWLLPKEATTVPISEEVEIEPVPQKPFENTKWDQPWKPSADERLLPITDERKKLVTKGLHSLTDERRILLLAIIGMTPDGVDGIELANRYKIMVPKSTTPRDHINLWLTNSGIADEKGRIRGNIRKMAPTHDGMELLPLAGHLLDWAIRHGKLKEPLGQPLDSRLEVVDNGEPRSPIRTNLEQVAYMLERSDKAIRPTELFDIEGGTKAHTRTRIHRMIEAGWLVVIPGKYIEESDYPVFVPKPLQYVRDNPKDIKDALLHYVSRQQAEKPGPMNLHGLVYHRQYLTLSRRAGGAGAFTTKIFQEYARLCDQGNFEEIDSGNVKISMFALNPNRLVALHNLVEIVRGAERGSDRFDLTGRQKLFQHCSAPSERLSRLILSS